MLSIFELNLKAEKTPTKRELKSVLIGSTVFGGTALLLSKKAGVMTHAENPSSRGPKRSGQELPPGWVATLPSVYKPLKTRGSLSVSFAA